MLVKPTTKSLPRFKVTADGDAVVNHAGSAALTRLADTLGLSRGLGIAMAGTRQRRSEHDPGQIIRDLGVMLADGGRCLSDLGALIHQPELFGEVASVSTAARVIDSIGPKQLEGIRKARSQAREKAWRKGAAPDKLVLDIDATLVTAHSEKEKAAGTYKRGFGFHPLLCYLDALQPHALAGILRPGNAGANTAADHISVIQAALDQLPVHVLENTTEILARADSGGASHEFTNWLREKKIRFSIGFDLTAKVRKAILAMPEEAWVNAITQEGEVRKGAGVCELQDLDLSAWPQGTRAICRRERPHPGAQLTFSDHNGFRFQVFITDQTDSDLAGLEARHRAHARVEDRIRCGKDTGLASFPFHKFAHNQAWLELVLLAQDLIAFFQALCLTGESALWEPKKLRYRLFHVAARIVRTGRRMIVKLQRNWPWSNHLCDAFGRLHALHF